MRPLRRSNEAALALLALVAASAVSSLARADAILPPASCPPSARDAFCHGPPTCEPEACTSTLDCATGEVCASRSLCTEPHACAMGTIAHVLGPCDASDACPGGGTCAAYFVCAPGPIAIDAARVDAGSAPAPRAGCGCRVGARALPGASLFGVLASLGGAWVGARRRRGY